MATSKIQKQYIVEWVTGGTIEIAKETYGSITIDISKTGYKAIGIVGVNKSTYTGDQVAPVCITNYRISTADPTQCSVTLYNPMASKRTPKVSVGVLYEKA